MFGFELAKELQRTQKVFHRFEKVIMATVILANAEERYGMELKLSGGKGIIFLSTSKEPKFWCKFAIFVDNTIDLCILHLSLLHGDSSVKLILQSPVLS